MDVYNRRQNSKSIYRDCALYARLYGLPVQTLVNPATLGTVHSQTNTQAYLWDSGAPVTAQQSPSCCRNMPSARESNHCYLQQLYNGSKLDEYLCTVEMAVSTCHVYIMECIHHSFLCSSHCWVELLPEAAQVLFGHNHQDSVVQSCLARRSLYN